MRVMTFSILLLVVACGACSSSGTGKGTPPEATPPENSPPPAATTDTPPTVTDADLTCGTNADCTEFLVWRWNDGAKGYCTGCSTQSLNQAGANRLLAWYQPRAGHGCPMHDCERPTHETACVEGRCALVPIAPATGE